MNQEFGLSSGLPRQPRSIEERLDAKALIQRCGLTMAAHFLHGQSLLLDGDGVTVKGDSLFEPELTTPDITRAIRLIEEAGVPVGVATARSSRFIDFLRSFSLKITGPAILEEGQLIEMPEAKVFLTSSVHKEFVAKVKKELKTHPNWRPNWHNVQVPETHANGELFFCDGHEQWQGDSRISFWFHAVGSEDRDFHIKREIIDATINAVGESFGLTMGKNYMTSLTRMTLEHIGTAGYLGIISLKSVHNGHPVNKSMAAAFLGKPYVFVADGVGDPPLGAYNLHTGGINIGLKGNLDVSNDPSRFMKLSAYVLDDPRSFAKSLIVAADFVRGSR